VLKGGQKNFVLNLGDVSYIDSSAWASWSVPTPRVRTKGAQIKLLNAQKRVDDLLQLTETLHSVRVVYERTDALRSFGAKACVRLAPSYANPACCERTFRSRASRLSESGDYRAVQGLTTRSPDRCDQIFLVFKWSHHEFLSNHSNP